VTEDNQSIFALPIRDENPALNEALYALPLSETEHQYRKLVASLPAAVYCCDIDGRVTLFNDAAVTLWGRTPTLLHEYWCGSHKMFTLDGIVLSHDRCPMAIAIRERREVGSIEAVVERPNGERRYVLAHPQLMYNLAGELVGATNLVTDITDRKMMEVKLLEVDEKKDKFLAMLAHELRNPLSPIKSAATTLEKTNTDEKVLRMANIITRQVAQLERLVHDLLDISRVTTHKISLNKTLTKLHVVMQSAIDVAHVEVQEREQELVVSLDGDSETLFCDQARVSQIIGNVLINASKYTQRNGTIKVLTEIHGAILVIRVEDNGIGIAAGKLDSIFNLYEQLDTNYQSKGGMGIGLSLVKELCELHGGHVQAFSDGKAKGSVFKISLPIIEKSNFVN
jgi:PAS domain S-box-containing protein